MVLELCVRLMMDQSLINQVKWMCGWMFDVISLLTRTLVSGSWLMPMLFFFSLELGLKSGLWKREERVDWIDWIAD